MKQELKATGCLVLFALPFAAVGVFTGWLALSMVWSWSAAQSWQEVPATLLEVNLRVNSGDDANTYRVEARYEYRWQGETYVSDRVWFQGMSDNIGSFHEDAARELREYLDAGRPFRAYVNPADPGEAVLYRHLRWLLLLFESTFALIFGTVGFGMLAAPFLGRRKADADAARKQQHSDAPWMWNEEWAAGRIRAGSRAEMAVTIFFAAIWNLISWPVVFALGDEWAAGNHAILIALIFPAIGIGLAAWAVMATLRWWRYGRAALRLDTRPGVIGGSLKGRIETGLRALNAETLELTLTCERRTQGRNGSRRALWQDTRRLQRTSLPQGYAGIEIPVDFTIPYTARPSTEPDEDTAAIRWNLEARGAQRGVDYRVGFEVPVFRTDASDATIVDVGEPEPTDPIALENDLRDAGISSTRLPDGTRRIVFARARHKAAAAGLSAFVIIWGGAIAVMWSVGAPMIFPMLFALFGIPLGWVALDMWLSRNVVTASRAELMRTGGILGRTRVLPADAIRAIEISSGTQAGEKLFFRLHAVTDAGRKVLIAKMLDDRRIARQVADLIRDGIGLEPGA